MLHVDICGEELRSGGNPLLARHGPITAAHCHAVLATGSSADGKTSATCGEPQELVVEVTHVLSWNIS